MVVGAQPVTREQRVTSRLNKWLADLELLGSLYVAYFIVWRELRRERKERIELKLEEVSRCKI
ncbi:MAG TPA: hypothetical protein VHQ94_01310 [Pyrinomonadaceae bacterium]|jgi:preprotein translocase subunit YajC|nr:hypothetical protein [Pyrinomonadaceae bacterium]